MLVVHVGLPKCGSSSLQGFLSTNREALAAAGIRYPEQTIRADLADGTEIELGHGELRNAIHALDTVSLSTEDYALASTADELLPWASLRDELSSDSYDHAIVSHESFLANPRNVKMRLIDEIFDPLPVHYVCFYRRHDHWIESRFRTSVVGRQRYHGSFVEYLEQPQIRNHSLRQRLQALQYVSPERLHLIPVERFRTSLGLFSAVLAPLGLEHSDVEGVVETSNQNQSHSLPMLMVMLAGNVSELSAEERQTLHDTIYLCSQVPLQQASAVRLANSFMAPETRRAWLELFNQECHELGLEGSTVSIEAETMPEPFRMIEDSPLLEETLESIQPFWTGQAEQFKRVADAIVAEKATLVSYFS